MSTCISRHGEWSDHILDDAYTCTRCLVLDEDALVDELRQARARLAEVEAERDAAHAAVDRYKADADRSWGLLINARAEVEAARPVVEAAVAYSDARSFAGVGEAAADLLAAVDLYRPRYHPKLGLGPPGSKSRRRNVGAPLPLDRLPPRPARPVRCEAGRTRRARPAALQALPIGVYLSVPPIDDRGEAMSEHGWTRHGHRCCDQATGPRPPGGVAKCGGPGLCGNCYADAAIRHSPGSGTFAAPTSPSEPVPSTPRVWAMPEIPEDVSAVRDRQGFVWHRAGEDEPDRWWNRADGRRISAESTLINDLGPLTEVEETAPEKPKCGPDPKIRDTYGEFAIEVFDLEPGNDDCFVVLLRNDEEVKHFTYPTYKIWTLLAHWKENDEVNPPVEVEETNDAD